MKYSGLDNKNILLGVCGGIAAYKSAELVRRLRDAGAEVRVVMTTAAMEFITPLTFQALSGHPVHHQLLDSEAEAAMGHIELARWADLILIAPATANTIARIAEGRADDLLSAIVLASQTKIALAPAMNQAMWSSAATQQNIRQLEKRSLTVLGPASGSQACGETGEGRLLEVSELVEACEKLFQPGQLQGLRIMLTAGPTFEPIDPVRFIGNRSSGRMGFAIAQAAVEQGARVTLIAGPVQLSTPDHVKRVDVETAEHMYQAVMDDIRQQDIFIATAAVADYRPRESRAQKIKKSSDTLSIELIRNPDILREVAALDPAPFTLGFAAETEKLQEYALQKLQGKNLDMIAANPVGDFSEISTSAQDTGFNSEYNALQVFSRNKHDIDHVELERGRKTELARQLLELLAQKYHSTDK